MIARVDTCPQSILSSLLIYIPYALQKSSSLHFNESAKFGSKIDTHHNIAYRAQDADYDE